MMEGFFGPFVTLTTPDGGALVLRACWIAGVQREPDDTYTTLFGPGDSTVLVKEAPGEVEALTTKAEGRT